MERLKPAVGKAKKGSAKRRDHEKEKAVAHGEEEGENAAWEAVKKAKREKDRFKVPPGAFNAEVFDMCQPFVTVITSDKAFLTGEQDKVSDGKEMDKKALKTSIEKMSAEYIVSSRCSKAKSKEMGIRDMHTSLAKAFWFLTTPRSKQELSRRDALHRREEAAQGPEELEGLELVTDEDRAEDSDGERPLTGSLDVQFEGDEGEANRNKESPQFDISFQVIDKSVQGIDKSVVVLVVECKWASLSVDDIYQVAEYTCTLAKENVAVGRYEPIYMEVWDERSWRHAIFYPEGIVQVEDCKVKGVIKSSTSMKLLQDKLNDHLSSLTTKYPNARYPDGEYLQGVLFVSMQKFLLPNAIMRGGGMTHDAQLFYQSKLRIIVGDKVLTWTEVDVEIALEKRTEQIGVAVTNFMCE